MWIKITTYYDCGRLLSTNVLLRPLPLSLDMHTKIVQTQACHDQIGTAIVNKRDYMVTALRQTGPSRPAVPLRGYYDPVGTTT